MRRIGETAPQPPPDRMDYGVLTSLALHGGGAADEPAHLDVHE